MCACRLEAQSSGPSTPLGTSPATDLEDYLYLEMDRALGTGGDTGNSSESEGDVYAQLAQKERDLILAAELGKALLEKNQELTRRNELANEEYSQKLEELTQEKHELRLRLEHTETEYENTVKELQNDISSLRHELDEHQNQSRQADRTKAQIVHELTQQNERLTEQLKKVSAQEEQLQERVHGMREQVHLRRNSMHQHLHQLEVLREEKSAVEKSMINMLTDRKTDLERRITGLEDERDTLSCNLEEAQDRILMLEKQKHEQEQQIRKQEREISELQDQNNDLMDKVEDLSLQATSNTFEASSTSLFSELEMSGALSDLNSSVDNSESIESMDHSMSGPVKNGGVVPRPNSLYAPGFPPGLLDVEEDDIECDDEIMTMATNLSMESLNDLQMVAKLQSPKLGDDKENIQLKQEIVDIYQQLREMVLEVKGRQEEMWSPEDVEHQQIKASNLMEVLDELRALMKDMIRQQHNDIHVFCPGDEKTEHLEQLQVKVQCLQVELQSTQEQVQTFRANMDLKDAELKVKSEELTELSNKVKLTIQQLSLQHQELQHVQAERDKLQDSAAGITRDEVVESARHHRDEAVRKRNTMEVELARSKLELMNMDSQLMEAIQQKIQLSQQLEQWQMDMQELIDIQMAKRIAQADEVEETTTKLEVEKSPALQRKRKQFPWS